MNIKMILLDRFQSLSRSEACVVRIYGYRKKYVLISHTIYDLVNNATSFEAFPNFHQSALTDFLTAIENFATADAVFFYDFLYTF